MTSPIHVFLAEDNRADVSLVNEALRFHELVYQLYVAEDCEEAIRFLEAVGKPGEAPRPNVALLDLNLPKGSGHELLQAIRSHPICAQVPVIIVTSSGAPQDRGRAAQLGADRYFRKPAELDEFMELGAIVRELIRRPEEESEMRNIATSERERQPR
jgi:DNA-binding response OmpR family regulator